jgi:hypothetical protein
MKAKTAEEMKEEIIRADIGIDTPLENAAAKRP